MTRSTLTLSTPPRFSLRRAACSYGYILLAPNRWDVATQSFSRPLRLADDSLVHVVVTQPDAPLRIACDRKLTREDAAAVKRQLTRMLRLGEDFTGWWKLNPEAKRARFGCLIRSPHLFEDMLKTVSTCNVGWPSSCMMNDLLCANVGKDGAFPTPAEVAAPTTKQLAKRTKVGYRADRIRRIARAFLDGTLDPAWFEDPRRTGEELYDRLLSIHGIGPYAASNLCQLLGRYDRIAIDTETYRHFCSTQNVERPKNGLLLHDAIESHYAKYAPYQFLGYWFDIWRFYESFIGRPAWLWKPEEGRVFTAAAFRAQSPTAA